MHLRYTVWIAIIYLQASQTLQSFTSLSFFISFSSRIHLSNDPVNLDWNQIVENVGNHIRSLNWGYRTQLRDINVEYINAFAELVDPHTVKVSMLILIPFIL